MRKRGVLYILWGDKSKQAQLKSIERLKRHHPELPIETVILECKDPVEGLLEKAKMMMDKYPFLDFKKEIAYFAQSSDKL